MNVMGKHGHEPNWVTRLLVPGGSPLPKERLLVGEEAIHRTEARSLDQLLHFLFIPQSPRYDMASASLP